MRQTRRRTRADVGGRTRFSVGSFAPIAVARRSGFDESLYHGAGVVIGADGRDVAVVGDPTVIVYPRSALKPLQARAMLDAGLDVDDSELALACASHDGLDMHVDVVRSLLRRVGLDESVLQNTPAHPLNETARARELAAHRSPSAIRQNCSGKHAAMLATCVVNDWPIDSYLSQDHPLQQAVTTWLGEHGLGVEHIGVDGCGAPAHAVSLRSLAVAYGALLGSRVHRAMTSRPDLVGGPERDVTVWMGATPGLLAKEGADAVFAFAHPSGMSGAFKVASGLDSVRRAVVPEAVSHAGVEQSDATRSSSGVSVLGHGCPVGEVHPLEWTTFGSTADT